jgi:hypothetical protein
MVIHDALGIARGAGGVVQRDGVPFVPWESPREIRISVGQEGLVLQVAQALARACEFRIVVVDDERLDGRQVQGRLHDGREFPVRDQDLCVAVIEGEGDHPGVETGVEGVEHRARHGNAIVALKHGGCVGKHCRDRVSAPDAPFGQSRGKASRAGIEVAIGAPQGAMNDRGPVRMDGRRSL